MMLVNTCAQCNPFVTPIVFASLNNNLTYCFNGDILQNRTSDLLITNKKSVLELLRQAQPSMITNRKTVRRSTTEFQL